MRHVLALDPAARRIGYAIGCSEMERPLVGVYAPPHSGARHGAMLRQVQLWMDATCKTYHVTKCIFEAPFGGPNLQAYALASKIVGIVELVCDDHSIPCLEVAPAEWRKHFIGRGIAPKTVARHKRRAWLKSEVVQTCRARGWDVKSDDEADACGVLDFMLCLDSPQYRERVTRQPSLIVGA